MTGIKASDMEGSFPHSSDDQTVVTQNIEYSIEVKGQPRIDTNKIESIEKSGGLNLVCGAGGSEILMCAAAFCAARRQSYSSMHHKLADTRVHRSDHIKKEKI